AIAGEIFAMGLPPGKTVPLARKAEAEISLPPFLRQIPAAQAPAIRILRPSGGADEFIQSPGADNGARFKRGLLIHALLSSLPDVPRAERREKALAYLARQNAESPEAILGETLRVLD